MTIAHFCLLVACVLPIVCAGIAKAGTFTTPPRDGGYDNRDPRAWLARQTGRRARANAAQANSFEALPLFIAAVLVAQQAEAAQGLVNLLAVAFVLLRVAYIALYVSNRAAARSLVWIAGFGVCIALFLSPLYAPA
jgi:uncharacterized MAPEG superfamily protein